LVYRYGVFLAPHIALGFFKIVSFSGQGFKMDTSKKPHACFPFLFLAFQTFVLFAERLMVDSSLKYSAFLLVT